MSTEPEAFQAFANWLSQQSGNSYRCNSYSRSLLGNQNSSGLQCEVAYWPAIAVDNATQLLWQSAAKQTHAPATPTMAFTPHVSGG